MKFFSTKRFSRFVWMLWLTVFMHQPIKAAETNLDLPPPATIRINYDRDIQPILKESCLRCHGGEKPRSHFRLDYPAAALAGGDDNTNDIVPGNSQESLLIAYVARQVPDLEMPPVGRGAPLTPQQIGLLRAWIDQGPKWTTTNQAPALSFAFTTTLRQFAVQGNQGKFRELEGVPAGVSGGVQDFSAVEQLSPDEKVSLTGHASVPDKDIAVQLALDKNDLGFIHAGFDQWRKYYATDGGYDAANIPAGFINDRDLHIDNGRAWVDFGLDKPRWPQIVLGYEYRYRDGNESTLDWGTADGKNIFPATQSVDEQTHTLKLDVSKDIDDWHLQDNARVSFYTEKNQGTEASVFSIGTTPGEFINSGDNYRQVQGMNTFLVSDQVRDWWFVNGGFYYSYLSGSDFFNQIYGFPLPAIGLSSQQITLSRKSEIFSIANLFTPMEGLSVSLGTQNEWTSENGFSESIPDLELGGNVPANSSLVELKTTQSANVRFTRIPFSVLFGDAQFSEDNYSIYQAEDTTELQRETAANAFRYDLKTGYSISPWRWADWTTQFERQSSDTDYNQLTDLWQGVFGPTNGYPAFILNREIVSDGIESKLVLHPTRWLKTTLSYQLTSTDYSSKTDPAYDAILAELVSGGGYIADGRSHSQTYGLSATLTPWRQLYLSGAFTYSPSRTVTADNGDPSIVPYEGDVLTFNASITYALNVKTSLQLTYNVSRANYSENNAVAGIPAGLDYLRQDVVISLSRKLTKHWSGVLRYEFSQYKDPGGGDLDNFTANGILASLVFQWP
jgi:hypothetical protein